MKKTISLLTLSIFSFVLGIVVVEGLLRVFWHPAYLNPKYKRNDIEWMSKNVVLNKFGYRDNEYMLQKSKDTYRFYFLGDSYTQGWYINNWQEAYPKVFEKAITESYPDKKIEVINAARPGFDFNAEVQRLENEGIAFSPDVIFVGVNIDDLVDQEFPPKLTRNKFLRSLKVYQLTIGNYKRAKSAKLNEIETLDSFKDGSRTNIKANENFARLKNLASLNQSDVVLIIFPRFNPANPNETYRYQLFHDFYKQVGEHYGFKIIDLYSPYSQIDDKTTLVLNPTDPHPTVLANKIAGEYIAEKLELENIFNQKPFYLPSKRTLLQKDSTLGKFIRILNIAPGWVINQTENGKTIQTLPLTGSDRKILYFEDKIVGDGKLEHYALGGKQLVFDELIYGYTINGISGVVGYWREDGSLVSKDLSKSSYKFTKGESDSKLIIEYPQDFEMYKITFDILANTVNIVDGQVTSVVTSSNADKPTAEYLSF